MKWYMCRQDRIIYEYCVTHGIYNTNSAIQEFMYRGILL